MKQKIVMKVPMADDTRRSAMIIAASVAGTTSVALEGSDKDRLVVVGDGVDAIKLIQQLRKKMRYTQLISVRPVRENIAKKDEEGGARRKTREIVMKVPMADDTKGSAIKIAGSVAGTTSAALEGSDKNRLVVVGDGVDAVELASLLRKKMGFTELISFGPVRENIEKKDEEGGARRKTREVRGKGVGGSEKKDKPDDSKKDKEGGGKAGEKKDKPDDSKKNKEGGGKAGEKKDKAGGELSKMGVNKVYGG